MLEGSPRSTPMDSLAGLKDTGTLAQTLRPQTHVGKATSQGVVQQRVDKVQAKGIDGKGITIGALSDSYDQATTTIPATRSRSTPRRTSSPATCPGKGNAKYPQPVVVLADAEPDGGFDEGRAMLQIAHDIAPASKLCFATAGPGELDFADNIRALADKNGKCKADVVVDDVTFLSEPIFSDGPIADAVDDVAKQGVHYFSAEGNSGEQQAWDSKVNLIPAKKGLKGTNINLDGVDPALYDGGFQDMDTTAGTDIAQNLRLGEDGGYIDLQWDDPVDIDGATYGALVVQRHRRAHRRQPDTELQLHRARLTGRQDRRVPHRRRSRRAPPTWSSAGRRPRRHNIGEVDTGASPEVLATTLKQAGTYKITISGFDDATG